MDNTGKLELIKKLAGPLEIIADPANLRIPTKVLAENLAKVPKASMNGVFEREELWDKSKWFIDFYGNTRKWVKVNNTTINTKGKTLGTSMPGLKEEFKKLPKTKIKYELPVNNVSGSFSPDRDRIAHDATSDTFLHETQHSIQHSDMLDLTGTNKDSIGVKAIAKKFSMQANAVYLREVGEIEARLAGRNITPSRHPLLFMMENNGLALFDKSRETSIFGNTYLGNKSVLLNKIKHNEFTALDLPEIRRFIQESKLNPDLCSQPEALTKLGFDITNR